MDKFHFGFFASRNGSNFQAVVDACKSGRLNGEPRVLITNNSKCYAYERALSQGIPAYVINAKTHSADIERDKEMLKVLKAHDVNFIVLAGYMKKISPSIIKQYPKKIVNIHPSLLPKYGGQGMYGMLVHEAVIAAGEKESGATVHYVDEIYDHGEVIGQVKVDILPGSSSEVLAKRVSEIEKELLVSVLCSRCLN
jgi:phosphoribosylglycinamide formyltransferase 1